MAVQSKIKDIYAWSLNRRVLSKVIKKKIFSSRQIDHINPSALHFGQQHIHTVDLFPEPYHTVPIEAFPHRELLSGNEEPYRKYLRQSWKYWGPENTKENRDEKVKKYKSLVADIQENGIQNPIQYFTRSDGKQVIYHGNHRSSVAHYLGIELPAVELSLDQYIFKNARKAGRIPYQSIYRNGTEVIVGRRRDVLSRFKLIDKADLKGNYVLDLCCNIGSSAFIAAENGADKVVGVGNEPNLVTSAIRINVAFAQPCDFIMADLSNLVELDIEFDTGFYFPTDGIIHNNAQLAENIQRHVTNTLYFEITANASIPEEIKMLAESIELRGTTGSDSNKDLYKCKLHSS